MRYFHCHAADLRHAAYALCLRRLCLAATRFMRLCAVVASAAQARSRDARSTQCAATKVCASTCGTVRLFYVRGSVDVERVDR